MSSLLEPITIGSGQIPLRNRVVMSSMTRDRCVDDNKPGPLQVKHYGERARDGVGLIINEGTLIDWTGSEWKHAPFMINDDHAAAWRTVTDEVHKQGGKIYFQAWHAGRCQNDEMPIMKERGGIVLAPSAIKAEGGKYRDLPGHPGHPENVKAIEDPNEVIEIYRRSAELARKAGFDGVEVLAQGGYLLHQFLNSRSNKRTDKYGGPVENRCRFVLEVVDVVGEVFGGPEYLSVRINPTDFLNDSVCTFDEMTQTYTFLIKELVARKVGIIHLGRRGAETSTPFGSSFGYRPDEYPLPQGYDPILEFGGLVKFLGSPSLLMANHDFTVEEATELIDQQKIDLVSFGRPFIYNPDVVTRIKHGIPFARNDRGSMVHYGSDHCPEVHYNDWPVAAI